MTKKKSLLYYSCLFSIFLLVGCTNKEDVSVAKSADTISELENKIVKLEQILEEHEVEFTKIQELDTLSDKISILDESNSYLSSQLYVLKSVIQHTISNKTAMLNSAEINGNTLTLNITYTNMITDEEAPNGFRLVETEEGTKVLSISKDVPVFLLENPGTSFVATWEQVVAHRGFLRLFEKDGKVVLISESYLP